MTGWKTITAVVLIVLYAVGGFIVGIHTASEMVELLLGAFALLGIGSKVSKLQIKTEQMANTRK